MNRKHAMAVVFALMIVGTLAVSVVDNAVLFDTGHAQLESTSPEYHQPADDYSSAEPLKTNVYENPSYEEWTDEDVSVPEGFSIVQTSEHKSVDFGYEDSGVTGNYGALLESQGSVSDEADNWIYRFWASSYGTFIEPGITFSLDRNILANPDIANEGRIYIRIRIWNVTPSGAYNLYYYLSYGDWGGGVTNSSLEASFMLNSSLNQWSNFNRNITEDFISAFGGGSLESTHYISMFLIGAYSPVSAGGKQKLALDNVVLTNGTYSDWIGNSDFESGINNGNYWQYETTSTRGYVEQSLDCTDGTYSLNLTVPENEDRSDGFAQGQRSFGYTESYFASEPEMFVVEFDWKYHDNASAGDEQRSQVTFTFYNQSGGFWLTFYLGSYDNDLHYANSTNAYYLKIPGFGVRDIWQSTRLDLYDYLTAVGFANVSLRYISQQVTNRAIGGSVYTLFDNFRVISYPLGDPGFEEDWYQTDYTSFVSWTAMTGDANITSRSTDAFLGNYACNFTIIDDLLAGIYTSANMPLHPSDLVDFAWRLDDIGGGDSYASIRFELVDGEMLVYILGSGSTYSETNTSSIHYIIADDFNVTGSWNHLIANLTMDFIEAFGTGLTMVLDRVQLRNSAPSGERLSILYDEFHFIDAVAPVVDSYHISPTTPVYYEDIGFTVYAHDDRTGVGSVWIQYINTTGSYGHHMDFNGENYTLTITSQEYGLIMFQVYLEDVGGTFTHDNNNSYYYRFMVEDDVNPTLTIDAPADMTEVEGLVQFDLTVDDPGSGIDRVEMYNGTTLLETDSVSPFSTFQIDTDTWNLGMYDINFIAYDNVGNLFGDTINIIVVDTIPPTINSPSDVEFDEGQTGNRIVWVMEDLRGADYEVYVNGTVEYTGPWSGTVNVSLDGFETGFYNFTCVQYDLDGNWVADTVLVTVNEVVTITTTTETISNTTTTTSTITEEGDTPWMLIGIGALGVVFVLVIMISCMRRK